MSSTLEARRARIQEQIKTLELYIQRAHRIAEEAKAWNVEPGKPSGATHGR